MKILVISNHSFMLWQFRRELIETLTGPHEVVISVPHGDRIENFEALGCRILDTPIDRRGIDPVTDLKLYCRYRAILKAERPDMVLTYSIKPNIYAGFACRQMHIPYFVNVQGLGTAFRKPMLSMLVTLMYRIALKDAKLVFFENESNAEEFRQRRIVSDSRCHVLPGAGVNLERFGCCPYPQNETVHFLFLGRIMREKGIDELFWSVRKLHAEGAAFVLDLAGFFEDSYKEQIDALEKDGIAVFHGFCQDPIPCYAAADCVVLPSLHEGMSNVLLEAAAIGRPIIASDIPGCREAILDGRSGLLCNAGDRQSLYEQMKRMLSFSHAQRREMGLRGRTLMEETFEKTKVVEKTVKAVTDAFTA